METHPIGVISSATPTDHALVRWDGTSGVIVQNSGIIVDDSDNVSGVGTFNSGAITATGTSSFAVAQVLAGLTVNLLNSLDTGLVLEGWTLVGDRRGGLITVWKDNVNVAGYIFANQNNELAFSNALQANNTDQGKFAIDFDDGALHIAGGNASVRNDGLFIGLGFKAGTLVITAGSIDDSGGSIAFGDTNFTGVGTIGCDTVTITPGNDIEMAAGAGHITAGTEGFIVGGLTITDGSIVDSGGAIDFNTTDFTAVGAIDCESITSSIFIDESLAAWWQFINNSAVDSSSNGEDGTFINQANAVLDVLELDGDEDSVSTTYGIGLNPSTTPHTYSMWVKADTLAGNPIFFYQSTSSTERLYIGINSNNWAIGITTSSYAASSGVSADTNWHLILLTIDGTWATLYVDGLYSGHRKPSGDFNFTDNARIGAFDIGTQFEFDGKMSDVRIHTRILSTYEIQRLYEKGRHRHLHTDNIIGPVNIGDGGISKYMAIKVDGDTFWVGAGTGLPYGEIYVNDNTTVTSVSSSGFTQFLHFDTNGHANLSTPEHAEDHIKIVKAGVYMVECCVNIKNSSGAAHDIEVVIAKANGTSIFPNLRRHRTLGTGSDVGAIPICGHEALSVDDTIEVWITSDSGSARDVIGEDVVLMLTMVGGV